MSRPSLATVSDLEDLLGESITPAAANIRAEKLLAMASEIVRAYAGETWLNDNEDDIEDVPAQIPDIVAAMVERATRNPAGITQEAAGPFSRSFGSDAAQRLYMTRSEKLVIRAAVGRNSVGTLATSRGPLETAPVGTRYYLDPPAVEEYAPFDL